MTTIHWESVGVDDSLKIDTYKGMQLPKNVIAGECNFGFAEGHARGKST